MRPRRPGQLIEHRAPPVEAVGRCPGVAAIAVELVVVAEIRKHTVVVPGCFAQPERLLGRRPRGLRVAQLEQALAEVAVGDRR